jgi:hypothetical protein
MPKFRNIALVAVGAAAFTGLFPAVASAHSATAAATASQGAASTADWPNLPPQCGHVVPVGSVFVKRVQPPYGLPYEIWRLPSGRLATVYC